MSHVFAKALKKILFLLIFCCLALEALPQNISPTFLESLSKHIKFSDRAENRVGYIAIEGKQQQISSATWIYVKKALEYYREHKPIFILLKLDTPGGQVFPAQQISDALRKFDFEEGIPIVAYIDDWAISAGAMIAYSSRYITTVDNGSMGAAEPVIQNAEGGTETASEKVNSAIRADFANRARIYGRNSDIAEAMVDKDIILVWRDGKVVRLNDMSEVRHGGADADIVISSKDKLLTLSAPEMLRYGVADLVMDPVKLEAISDKELEKGLWPAAKTQLFHYPFFDKIPNAVVDAYRMDWKTQLFVWLAMPVVSSLLLMGLLMGMYMEFNTPGFGIPGTVALVCLLLIILSSFSLEVANWLEVILLLSGILMIAAEIFALPTGGILGAVGVFFFLAGLVGVMVPGLDKVDFEFDSGTLNAAGEMVLQKLAWLSATIVAAFLLMTFLGRFLLTNRGPLNRFVLSGGEEDAEDGYVATTTHEKMPPPGSRGVVTSALRPAGKVTVGDNEFQALSSGLFIGEGAPVRIMGREGAALLVEPWEEGQ